MRSDFATFILTHGRADNVVTVKALKRGGYTGKLYFIIDNEDEQAALYKKRFGAENVIVFDKQAAYDRSDTMDNFNEHRAIIYARNESYRIAKNLGLKYFLMLDDDYTAFNYRYIKDDKLLSEHITDLDKIFSLMIDFLDKSNADTVAFAQGGDLIGGINPNFKKRLIRKAMNSFFCRTDRPIEFCGTMNEDVVTYTTLSSRGRLFFTYMSIIINPLATQSVAGGMSQAYKDGGTFLKSFYAVMSMPSAVIVNLMPSKHKRIHHHINWNACAPKILNEKWQK